MFLEEMSDVFHLIPTCRQDDIMFHYIFALCVIYSDGECTVSSMEKVLCICNCQIRWAFTLYLVYLIYFFLPYTSPKQQYFLQTCVLNLWLVFTCINMCPPHMWHPLLNCKSSSLIWNKTPWNVNCFISHHFQVLSVK